MTITGPTAAIVVLEKQGETWCRSSTSTAPIERVFREAFNPCCPVVLDASAWRQNAEHSRGPCDAARLLGAGWDVRPPLWREGKAANATREEFEAAMATDGFAGIQFAPDVSADVLTAFALACWGAMAETSAEPPDLTEATCYNGNHGARDGVCVVDGGLKPDPDLRALLATGDVRGRPEPLGIEAAKCRRRCGAAVVGDGSRCERCDALPASDERALDVGEVERQRDEAEAALLAMVRDCDQSVEWGNLAEARELLKRRGRLA
jgi:hypothetical protein